MHAQSCLVLSRFGLERRFRSRFRFAAIVPNKAHAGPRRRRLPGGAPARARKLVQRRPSLRSSRRRRVHLDQRLSHRGWLPGRAARAMHSRGGPRQSVPPKSWVAARPATRRPSARRTRRRLGGRATRASRRRRPASLSRPFSRSDARRAGAWRGLRRGRRSAAAPLSRFRPGRRRRCCGAGRGAAPEGQGPRGAGQEGEGLALRQRRRVGAHGRKPLSLGVYRIVRG